MGAIQNSINQALGVAAALKSIGKKYLEPKVAEMANKRATEMKSARETQKAQVTKIKQSYLDQPISIGGKEIGTVRGLPKDMRSQVKEGMKNAR